jgi:hypothetical protein
MPATAIPPPAKKVNSMNRQFYMLSFGIGAMLLAATHAQSATFCGDHAAVVARLEGQYGEGRRAMGLGANNIVFEIYASEETSSWTITATQPGDPTCIMAAGQAFQLDQLMAKDDGNDT